MNARFQAALTLAAIGLAATAITRNADACGISDLMEPAVAPWSMPVQSPGIAPGSIVKDVASPPASNESWFLGDPITGLYQFKFVSEGSNGIPDGTVVDQGFVTWHNDGTEIMNSGRPPSTGSFCMGVWRHTGQRAYKLNHFALSWDPTGASLIGPTNIKENIQLARNGSSYSGSFSLTQYATDGTTVLALVIGNVSGTRVTVDSN
ncbi:MAG: hypothetical protein ABI082_08940 [Dokdonella sp.]